MRNFRAVVLGASAGGIPAIQRLVGELRPSFPLPLLLVLHLPKMPNVDCTRILGPKLPLPVVEAGDKLETRPGHVYLAPAGYHLLVERDGSLALDVGPPINFARPSVDVLFETAAEAFGAELVAVVLSGANTDGASGMHAVRRHGGLTLVQALDDAEVTSMPQAAMAIGADLIAPAVELGRFLNQITGVSPEGRV